MKSLILAALLASVLGGCKDKAFTQPQPKIITTNVVNQKYKDSVMVKALEKHHGMIDITRWTDGDWNLIMDICDDVSVSGKGLSMEAAYEDALKKGRGCQ